MPQQAGSHCQNNFGDTDWFMAETDMKQYAALLLFNFYREAVWRNLNLYTDSKNTLQHVQYDEKRMDTF